MSAAKCVAALRAFVDGGPAAAQIFTRRWRGSAGENTSAGIELWRAGVVIERVLQRPRVVEPGGARRADVAGVDGDEVHIRSVARSQAIAAVVAGIQDHDDRHRAGRAQCGGGQRAQALRQMRYLVVRRHHDHGLPQSRFGRCHGAYVAAQRIFHTWHDGGVSARD